MARRYVIRAGPVMRVRHSWSDALREARRWVLALGVSAVVDYYDATGPVARYRLRSSGDRVEVSLDDGWANPWTRKH